MQVGRALLMISDLYDYYAELLNAGDGVGDGAGDGAGDNNVGVGVGKGINVYKVTYML